jgi:hypothetical protein
MKGTTLQFGGGELGTISSAAVHAGTIGKFGYRLSIGRDQTQQWRDRDALGFRSNKFNVQTEYALSSTSKLQVSGGLVDTNRYDGQVGEVTSNSIRPSLAYANVILCSFNILLSHIILFLFIIRLEFLRIHNELVLKSNCTAPNIVLSKNVCWKKNFGKLRLVFIQNFLRIHLLLLNQCFIFIFILFLFD